MVNYNLRVWYTCWYILGTTRVLFLRYYAKIDYAPLSVILIKDNIKTDSQLVVLSGFIWKEFSYTGIISGAYIVFYQGGKIDHCTHVPGPVSK